MKLSLKLSLLIGGSLLALLFMGTALIIELNSTTSGYNSILNGSIVEQDKARVIQVDFKKQIQEWKDILLRGHDPEMLKKYTEQFNEKQTKVKQSSIEFVSKVEDKSAKRLLEEFIKAHEELSTSFDSAYHEYINSGFNFKSADKIVAGKDRKPTNLFDSVVARLKDVVTEKIGEQQKANNDVINVVIIVSILIVLGFGIIGILIVRSALNQLGADPKIVKDIANNLAEGNTNINIDTKGKKKDSLIVAMDRTINAIKGLTTDAIMLSEAGTNGNLEKRANANEHKGIYKNVIEGFNNTLDAIIGPLNVSAEYIDRISNGDFPEKIHDNYKGDFNEIKNNLNRMIDNLNNFVEEMYIMAQHHELGDIDYRINTKQFVGTYCTLASGVNGMAESHINIYKNAMNIASEYGRGNFDVVMNDLPGQKAFVKEALDNLRSNLIQFNNEILQLINASKEGKLKQRGNADNYHGGWKELVLGLNSILDSILNPINEAVSVLTEMSNGNLSVKVNGNYKGDHAIIKNALNDTIDLMPFKEAIEVFSAMSSGDLTKRMVGNYKGDSLAMKESVNETLQSLNEILEQVRVITEEVNRGAVQVSDASTALSQGATEQAASLEEITSSISEIASTTRINAENSNQANILVNESKVSSEKGNHEMNDLNKAMEDINNSSKNISKIIKVIDEIAFQTNLLALNAAVEAARAGRQGKGFAVVAEEVRNLAARSAKAAKETAELIESSIKTVSHGSQLAEKTSSVLVEIKSGAVKVADIVHEISSSSNEQAEGISQINEGLMQIDKVTQTNTASAEESASAAEELSGQANQLRSILSRFKLSNGSYNNITNDMMNNIKLTTNRIHPTLSSGSRHELEARKRMKPETIIQLDDDEFGKY